MAARKGRYIPLQVPKSIDLVRMSDEEINRLVRDTAGKVAATLPRDSALLGFDGVELATSTGPDCTIWGEWIEDDPLVLHVTGWQRELRRSRGCGRAASKPGEEVEVLEGLRVNPQVFTPPRELTPRKGRKVVIDRTKAPVTAECAQRAS